MSENVLELKSISKFFGNVIALSEVSLALRKGEVHCLLGDNGAGKSTLIKILSGVYRPGRGEYAVDGNRVRFTSSRDALDMGIATVFQDLALVPLMSISRNFFMGREPEKKLLGLFPVFDHRLAEETARKKLKEMGIVIRDANQTVGTMSGGERQSLAIARAIHFGARVLILDEPTAALGVKQSGNVLRLVAKARQQNISVILITHNAHHAYPIGDRFTLLNRGKSMGTFDKSEISKEELVKMMSGGAELDALTHELEKYTS